MRTCGVIFVCGAALTGCTASTPPAVRVMRVDVGERTADASVLRITLDAENRNDTELPLEELRYAVRLDGREVFRATRAPEASLRRLGTQKLTIPAVVPSALMPTTDARFEITGELQYRRPGEISRILYDNRLWRPSATFADQGVINLTPAPAGSGQPGSP